MANVLFTAQRNQMWGTGTRVDLDADTIRAMLIDHGVDVPLPDSDANMSDIASGARLPAIASCPTLGSVTIGTVGDGIFDAADVVFTALSGSSAESLVLFKDTGNASTSSLIAYWDTATGLPLTPNGGNVTVVWSASGIGQV